MKYLANTLTLGRLVGAVWLWFLAPASGLFWAVYLLCGVSDMLDGPIARRTHTASAAGATLDSIADFAFLAVCLARLLPLLAPPAWAWGWAGAVAAVKLFNFIYGFWRYRVVFLHTTANRLTGALLFAAPLALLPLHWPTAPVLALLCAAASFAAGQEGWRIWKGKLGVRSEE